MEVSTVEQSALIDWHCMKPVGLGTRVGGPWQEAMSHVLKRLLSSCPSMEMMPLTFVRSSFSRCETFEGVEHE